MISDIKSEEFRCIWVIVHDLWSEYLRINNPHKTSLYLSSGIPVVIWKEAALADFVIENNVGIAVDSLENIESILDKVTKEDYDKMKKNAYKLSKKLRSGYFTMNAINKCIWFYYAI